MLRPIKRLLLVALCAMALAACRGSRDGVGAGAGSPDDPAAAACVDLGPAVVAALTGQLTVAGGGTISAARYIRLTEARGTERTPEPVRRSWYAVAATLEGPGLDSLPVLWITDADLPGDSTNGQWFSASDMAKEFSVHPWPVGVPSWVMTSPDLQRAVACVEER